MQYLLVSLQTWQVLVHSGSPHLTYTRLFYMDYPANDAYRLI